MTSRRTFLSSLAATGAASAAIEKRLARPGSKAPRSGRVLGANDRINLAYIGCGTRFTALARGGKERKASKGDVEILAACDVYEKRRQNGKTLLAAPDSYVDYRDVLSRSDIDGVFIAVPDHLHYQIAADACLAGKDVYLEKPMTYTTEEAVELAGISKRTGRVMQIGVTGMYAGIYPAVRQFIAGGKLGKPVWAVTSYCRNSAEGEWNYRIDADSGPHNIDWTRWLGPAPKRRFSKERYFRWRKYKDYSGGVATDLLYHRLSPLVYILGEDFPTRVSSSGGIYLFEDREVPDNFFMSAEYPGNYTVLLVSSMNNALGLPTRIYGQYGAIEFQERANSATVTPERTFLKRFRELNNGASEVTLQGEARPDMIHNWLDAMRTRGKTHLDAELGAKIMAAIRMGVDSYYQGEMKLFDARTRRAPKKAAARAMYRPGDA